MIDQSGSRLSDVLKELLETSSLHGLPKIVSSRQLIVKILWLLLFLATAVILGLQIYDLHHVYVSYPIQTSVGLEFSSQSYPAISLCNMNPIKASKVMGPPATSDYLMENEMTTSLPKEEVDEEVLSNPSPQTFHEEHAFNDNYFSDHDSEPTSTTTVQPTTDMSNVTGSLPSPTSNVTLNPGSVKYNDYYDYYNDKFWSKYDDYDYDYVRIDESPKDQWEEFVTNLKNSLINADPETRRKFGHRKDDFIHRVTYMGRIQDTSDYDQFLTYDYGNCYTIHSDHFKAWSSGFEHGIKLMLNLEIDEYIPNFADGYGVRMVFHQPGTYPMPASEGLTINAGFETNVGLRVVNVSRMGTPYGHCQDSSEFEKKYNVTYTVNACMEFCRLEMMIGACGCLPERSPDIEYFRSQDYSLCALQDEKAGLFCVKSVDDILQNPVDYCSCLEPCSEIVYDVSTSFRKWPNKDYLENVVMREMCNNATELWEKPCRDLEQGKFDHEKYSRNFIKLIVYFESLNYETIRQSPLYERARFLSDIGGTMGLFTGASVLSFVEILQLFLELFVYFRSRGKQRPVVKDTNSVF